MNNISFLVSVIFLALSAGQERNKVILCHIHAWSIYRPSQGKFSIEDIDTKLCTHIVYDFLGMNQTTNTIESRDKWADFGINGTGLLRPLLDLRNRAENSMKVLVSIGGWAEASIKFSNMAASTIKRDTFVQSVIRFAREHDLDGIDIHWQYPTDRGGIAEDKRNFVQLLRDLKDELDQLNKILTVHLCPKRYIIDPGYDVFGISQIVDYMAISAFEYNGPWERRTGINSPLVSDNEFSVTFTTDYYIKKGAMPSKLLLGVPTYGHSFNMLEIPKDGNYIKVESDDGYISPWTREKGVIGYNEICYELKSTPGWKEMWDETSSTPIAINKKKFISYDNQRSILEKVKVVTNKGLGGAMIWTLDTDDFLGLCHGQKYPLTTLLRDHLNNKNIPITIFNSTVVSHSYG